MSSNMDTTISLLVSKTREVKMNIHEISIKQKAGIIPYYINDKGTPLMMFMIPSNPTYGGSKFQIAKGHIDPDESPTETAIREGTEELGLVYANVKKLTKVSTSTITGLDDTYQLTVFAAKVSDPDKFNAPHYETGNRARLSMDEFLSGGRSNQLSIVQQTYNHILRADGRDQVS